MQSSILIQPVTATVAQARMSFAGRPIGAHQFPPPYKLVDAPPGCDVEALNPAPNFLRLQGRVRQVAELASTGFPNKRIANALGIAEATVKVHLKEAYRRLGINTRSGLVSLARPTARIGRDADLSERDLLIARLVHAGQSNKQIARAVGLADNTVHVRLRAMLRACGVANRTQLAGWYFTRHVSGVA